MLVYRVEHKEDNYGPYVFRCTELDSTVADVLCLAHEHDTLRPPVTRDGIANVKSSEFCCFDSLDCLHIWFEGWLELLARNGFVIGVYEVNDLKVRHGKNQSVFVLREAQRVDELACTCNAL